MERRTLRRTILTLVGPALLGGAACKDPWKQPAPACEASELCRTYEGEERVLSWRFIQECVPFAVPDDAPSAPRERSDIEELAMAIDFTLMASEETYDRLTRDFALLESEVGRPLRAAETREGTTLHILPESVLSEDVKKGTYQVWDCLHDQVGEPLIEVVSCDELPEGFDPWNWCYDDYIRLSWPTILRADLIEAFYAHLPWTSYAGVEFFNVDQLSATPCDSSSDCGAYTCDDGLCATDCGERRGCADGFTCGVNPPSHGGTCLPVERVCAAWGDGGAIHYEVEGAGLRYAVEEDGSITSAPGVETTCVNWDHRPTQGQGSVYP